MFTGSDKTKLDAIEAGADRTDSGNVESAGAVMESDIANTDGFVTRSGTGFAIDTNTYLTAASDDVGSVSATDGKWCTSLGSKVDCNQASPVLVEADPKIGALTSNKWCTTDGSAITCSSDIPWGAPGAIGQNTPTAGTFANLTVKNSMRINDDDASNYLSLQAPANLADNLTVYTLPASPDAGKALVTDAGGVLSWVALDSEVTYKDETDLTATLDDNYQAKNNNLSDIAAIGHGDGNFLVSDGTN